MSSHPDCDTAEFPAWPKVAPRAGQDQPRPARVEFGALTHPGRVRPNNEDHFLAGRIRRAAEVLLTNAPDDLIPREHREDGYVMVVADGMGGAASGEHASLLAIVTGLRLVLNTNQWNMPRDEAQGRSLLAKMQEYFNQVDEALLAQARDFPQLAGMGTTLIVSYSVGDRLFVVHAGDSRAYLVRGGSLERLTRDHTLAEMLAAAGHIGRDEVGRHNKRHVLTNFLGGPARGVTAEIQEFRLLDADRVLLCSDGLTEMVDDESIRRVLLDQPEPQGACEALVNLALERGGADNVTVVIARYEIPGTT
jgi:protein phosphatase